jgi:hypothetical protein
VVEKISKISFVEEEETMKKLFFTLARVVMFASLASAQVRVIIKDPQKTVIDNSLTSLTFTASDNTIVILLKNPVPNVNPNVKVTIDDVDGSAEITGITVAISTSQKPTPVSPAPTPSGPCAKPTTPFPAIFWAAPQNSTDLLLDIQGDSSYFGGWACYCPTNPAECWTEYKKVSP